MPPGACKFLAVPHSGQALPGKRVGKKTIERTVSQTGWKAALESARKMRDATVFLSCPGGDIPLARAYDYSLRLLTMQPQPATKTLAGLKGRRGKRR